MSGEHPSLFGPDGKAIEFRAQNSYGKEALSGFPSYIPWHESGTEPKFVVDAAQEGLARQLRMFGFDTKSTPNLRKTERNKVFRFLVESAQDEGRVILSCDRLLFQRRASRQAYWVQGKTKQQQVDEVVKAFGLVIDESNLMSRCGKCNGDFVSRGFKHPELPVQSQQQAIPQKVLDEPDTVFWVCKECHHVYWRGYQFERCHRHLTARLSQRALII